MTKEEIQQVINLSYQYSEIVANEGPIHQSRIDFILEGLKEQLTTLPSNLDEAAEEYGRKEYSHAIHFWDEGLSKNKPELRKEDFVSSFKAGVEWMAEQGMV